MPFQRTLPFLLTLLFCSNLTHQRCRMFQESITTRPREAKTKEEQTPEIYASSEGVCEDFVGKEVCCREAGRTLLMINLIKLEATSDCQTCINNLKRFMLFNKLPYNLFSRSREIHGKVL